MRSAVVSSLYYSTANFGLRKGTVKPRTAGRTLPGLFCRRKRLHAPVMGRHGGILIGAGACRAPVRQNASREMQQGKRRNLASLAAISLSQPSQRRYCRPPRASLGTPSLSRPSMNLCRLIIIALASLSLVAIIDNVLDGAISAATCQSLAVATLVAGRLASHSSPQGAHQEEHSMSRLHR